MATKNTPKFSVIIVNYNSGDYLAQLIASFCALNLPIDHFEFFIIDNASEDNSLSKVDWKGLHKEIILNKQNFGFAHANNQGIKLSKGVYMVLLNPDTRLVNNIFEYMEAVLLSKESIGICGTRLIYPDGSSQLSTFSFPSFTRKLLVLMGLTDFFAHNKFFLRIIAKLKLLLPGSAATFSGNFNNSKIPVAVPWVSGACMMIKREIIERIGLLDENFFAYAEDMDFCFRARQAGYEIYYVPEAKLIHYLGFKRSSVKTRKSVDIYFAGVRYFYVKHYKGLRKFIFLLLNKIDWNLNRIKAVKTATKLRCPICDNNADVTLIEQHREYKIFECPLCKGQISNPLVFDATNYKTWYKEDLYDYIHYEFLVSMTAQEVIDYYRSQPYIKLALTLLKGLNIDGKLLDIGCSQGAFCKLAQELGFEVCGIDPAEEAIKYASQQLNLKNVFVGSSQEIPNHWKDFNIITLLEVIEHLSNPREMVRKSFDLLKPGGYLLLSTPNNNRLGALLNRRLKFDFPPHHLTRWRAHTITLLLKEMGLNNIVVKITPIDRIDIGSICAQNSLEERAQILGLDKVSKRKTVSESKKLFLLSPLWTLAQLMGNVLAWFLNLIFPGGGTTLVVLAQKPFITEKIDER